MPAPIATDVVVADRYLTGDASGSRGGSMADLIARGFATAGDEARMVWVAPAVIGRDHHRPASSDRATTRCVPIPPSTYDTYYLTVGAERLWTALHGIAWTVDDDRLTDDEWREFLAVNQALAAAAAEVAPPHARITVHDYTLLFAVPVIRRYRPDVSLVYVHHTPWPNRDEVRHEGARVFLVHMAEATKSADAIVVSANQWRDNLHTWSTARPVCVAPPGLDVTGLRQRTHAALGGHWASLLGPSSPRPIVAAVGRLDPAKNFDTLLEAWIELVKAGVPGSLCLHLIPTTRRSVRVYREYADRVRQMARDANGSRPGAVLVFERESQGEALWLLQFADVVVACSRADGWNLVAAEAVALGPDEQRLILSSRTGAAELLGTVASVVDDPLNASEIAVKLRAAMFERVCAAPARAQVALPTSADWWAAIADAHRRCRSKPVTQ